MRLSGARPEPRLYTVDAPRWRFVRGVQGAATFRLKLAPGRGAGFGKGYAPKTKTEVRKANQKDRDPLWRLA